MTDIIDLGPGWELGDGSVDGAMLVDGEWYHPVMGCDSLQATMDHLCARLALARAGTTPNGSRLDSTIRPIPLTERSPGRLDLDDDGRCWYADQRCHDNGDRYLCWGLQASPTGMDEYWLPVNVTSLPLCPGPAILKPPATGPSGTTPP